MAFPRLLLTTLIATLTLAAGCGLHGTWRVDSVFPPGQQVPFQEMTLESDGTAVFKHRVDGEMRTVEGTHRAYHDQFILEAPGMGRYVSDSPWLSDAEQRLHLNMALPGEMGLGEPAEVVFRRVP